MTTMEIVTWFLLGTLTGLLCYAIGYTNGRRKGRDEGGQR